ncbi:MAG: CBS domain-containing protein, partial [Acidimicrobiia bacterium]
RPGLLHFVFREESLPDHELHVGDVMTAEVISIGPEADHAEAARIMHDRAIKRIPVVDGDGHLVGLISRSDIMRAFTRSDEDILDEIEGVMRKILWIDPRRTRITSVDGHVALRGQLETRSDVDLLEEMVRRVDGVVSVESHMSFEVDNTRESMVSPPVGMPTRGW